MIDAVYILPNGLVAVFRNGEQVEELQGPWHEKAREIFAQCTAETLIYDYRAFADLMGDVVKNIKRTLTEALSSNPQ